MDSFEINKILGAILGTCLGVLSLNIAAGAIFAPTKPAKPGYDIAVPEQAPAGRRRGAGSQQQPIEQLLASADAGRGRERGQEMRRPATPSTRAGRTGSAPTSRAWSAGRRHRRRASTIRPR